MKYLLSPISRIEEDSACNDKGGEECERQYHGSLKAATKSLRHEIGRIRTMPVDVAGVLHFDPPPPASTIKPLPMAIATWVM